MRASGCRERAPGSWNVAATTKSPACYPPAAPARAMLVAPAAALFLHATRKAAGKAPCLVDLGRRGHAQRRHGRELLLAPPPRFTLAPLRAVAPIARQTGPMAHSRQAIPSPPPPPHAGPPGKRHGLPRDRRASAFMPSSCKGGPAAGPQAAAGKGGGRHIMSFAAWRAVAAGGKPVSCIALSWLASGPPSL